MSTVRRIFEHRIWTLAAMVATGVLIATCAPFSCAHGDLRC